MERKTVSKAELLKWLNSELHKDGDFKECRFTSIAELDELDEIGCNWDNANLSCSGISVSVCHTAASRITEAARKMFNVE